MRKIIEWNWSREREVVPALLLGCFDRRFRTWRGRFGELMGFDTNYPITIPGGAKDLVMPKHPRDAEYLLEKIALLSDQYKMLGVMVHSGCLECDERTDPAFYEDLLHRAGVKLRQHFPRHEILLIYADFNGLYLIDEDVPALQLVG
jgi:hypothetical protein